MIEKIFTSKKFTIITWILALLILLGVFFWLGVCVGYRKAAHSYRFGETYGKNFGGHREGSQMPWGTPLEFPESHGAIGQILKIEPNVLVLRGIDGMERIVRVTASTTIMMMRERISATDLQVDQHLMVIGDANGDGEIIAKFGRVLPAPAFEWENKK